MYNSYLEINFYFNTFLIWKIFIDIRYKAKQNFNVYGRFKTNY